MTYSWVEFRQETFRGHAPSRSASAASVSFRPAHDAAAPDKPIEIVMHTDMRSDLKQSWDRTVYCDPANSLSHDFIDELLVKTYVHAEDWKLLPHSIQG